MTERRVNADLIDWALLGHPARQGYRPQLLDTLQPVLVVNPASTIQADSYTDYAVAYKSAGAMVANVAIQAIAPATNVNGIILWRAGWHHADGGAATGRSSVIAKAGAAPASLVDGDVLSGTEGLYVVSAAYNAEAGKIENPIKIAAGKGLYFITDRAVSAVSYRYALYTILA